MSLETESSLLHAMPLFRAVHPARCKLVAMSSDRLEFQPGEVVLAEGEPSTSVFVIVSGRVRVTRGSADRVAEIARLGEGTLLGETGVITGRPRNATITAIEPTAVLRIDGRVFVELLQQVPELCFAMTRELAERAERSDDRVARAVADL